MPPTEINFKSTPTDGDGYNKKKAFIKLLLNAFSAFNFPT